MIYHYYYKQISLKFAILLIGLFAFFLGELEYYRSVGKWFISPSIFSFLIDKFFSTFVVFDNFIIVLQNVGSEKIGFFYGIPYLNLIFFPIPRAVWPDKPVYVDQILTKELIPYGPELNTFTILGDFYANFSIVGIIFGMLFWGIIWRTLYSYLIQNQKSLSVITIYAVAATLGFTTVRASFIEFLTVWSFLVLPMAVAIGFIGQRYKISKSFKLK